MQRKLFHVLSRTHSTRLPIVLDGPADATARRAWLERRVQNSHFAPP